MCFRKRINRFILQYMLFILLFVLSSVALTACSEKKNENDYTSLSQEEGKYIPGFNKTSAVRENDYYEHIEPIDPIESGNELTVPEKSISSGEDLTDPEGSEEYTDEAPTVPEKEYETETDAFESSVEPEQSVPEESMVVTETETETSKVPETTKATPDYHPVSTTRTPSGYYDNDDFGYYSVKALTDKDGDGIDDQTDIVQAARAYINSNPIYDASRVYKNGYPNDGYGVCTDVVGKAMLAAGYDLRQLVNDDVARRGRGRNTPYPYAEGNYNLDFRRVRVLYYFFLYNATVLTNDVYDTDEWQGGDIVIFIGRSEKGSLFDGHAAIVSDKRSEDGIPYILHHSMNDGPGEHDFLTIYSYTVLGHFRWPSCKIIPYGSEEPESSTEAESTVMETTASIATEEESTEAESTEKESNVTDTTEAESTVTEKTETESGTEETTVRGPTENEPTQAETLKETEKESEEKESSLSDSVRAETAGKIVSVRLQRV